MWCANIPKKNGKLNKKKCLFEENKNKTKERERERNVKWQSICDLEISLNIKISMFPLKKSNEHNDASVKFSFSGFFWFLPCGSASIQAQKQRIIQHINMFSTIKHTS